MPKHLTADKLEEMKSWLQDLQVPYKNLSREFSDALLVANILKTYFPKLVDLHNYPPCNNTKLKQENWETLNCKVLTKLGISQHKSTLDKLAQGVTCAIKCLLYDIMAITKNPKIKDDKSAGKEQEQIWAENDEIMTVEVNKRICDTFVQVPQKMILFAIYEKVVKESQLKDNLISSLQQQIIHLENVIKLKEERIEELYAQMAKLSIKSLLPHHNLEQTSSSMSFGTPLAEEQSFEVFSTGDHNDSVYIEH